MLSEGRHLTEGPLALEPADSSTADHPHGNQLRKDGKETRKLCHKAAICYRELLLGFCYHKIIEEQAGRDLKGPLVQPFLATSM